MKWPGEGRCGIKVDRGGRQAKTALDEGMGIVMQMRESSTGATKE